MRDPLNPLFLFALLVILVAIFGYMVGYVSAAQVDPETIRVLDDNLLEEVT